MVRYYRIFGLNDPSFKDVVYSIKGVVMEDEVFVQGRSGKLLNKHFKHVSGAGVTKLVKLRNIKYSVSSIFRAGNSLEFKGTVVGSVFDVYGAKGKFLKIKVQGLIKTFVFVRIDENGRLKLKQKIINKE